MSEKKFDPKKLYKLNNPDRVKDIPPEFIWNELHLEKAKILVDIGAGTGFFSTRFFNLSKNGKNYSCDILDIMIQWMKENICPQYPDIIPLKMQESVVPLEDEIADLVYMINLHHELEEPGKILQESLRILKKGGTLFIVDWKREEMEEGPPLRMRCLPDRVKQQLLAAGFEQITISNEMVKHFLVSGAKRG